MHSGQQLPWVVPAGAGSPLAAPFMGVPEAVQADVPIPAVGDDPGARLHGAGDERVQRLSRAICQHRHPAPADPLRLAHLHRNAGQHLLPALTATAQPGLLPADERLVHLDAPRQPAPPRADQHRPQPVQHSPRRRIRADLQRALKVLSGDPVLGRGKQPARVKPHRQRRVHTVKDRTRRHRGAPPAAAALTPAIAQPPAAGVTTRRACKPARPAQPLQVVQAVLIGAEPGQELSRRARVVRPGARIFHSTSLLRLTV